MWQVIHPGYWWAAGALLLPIVIHLYNRRSSKVKQLGTLRWLKEVQPAQANFRRIQQWPLLVIRLLLVILVVLLLVQLYWDAAKPERAKKLSILILIHPQAGDTIQFRQLANGWKSDSVQVRWLTPNFPVVTENVPTAYAPIWSLVADAARQFPADSIHFIAPNRADYFAGKQPALASAISWELTDWKRDTTRLLQVVANDKEPELLWFQSGSERTETAWKSAKTNASSLQWQPQSVTVTNGKTSYPVPIQQSDTLIIFAQYEASQQDEWKLLQTGLQALGSYHRVPLQFTQNAQRTHWAISLNQKPIKADSALLFIDYKPMETTAWLEPAKTDSLIMRKSLTMQHILDGGLLEALRPYVLAFKSRKAIAPEVDFRKVDLTQGTTRRLATANVSPVATKPAENTRRWLGIITLVFVAIERLWPKQTR